MVKCVAAWLGAAWVLGSLVSAPAGAAEPRVSVDRNTVTIATDRYEVAWRDGCMVGLTTLLPGRVDLTSKAAPTDVAQLPNGLGSFHGQPAQAVYAQHAPWGTVSPPFPAQHLPAGETKFEAQPVPNGITLTYRGLSGDPGATLVQELSVDPADGDLVIRQEGQSPEPGVFGISFSVLNLRPDVELIVPYFGGQRWGRDKDKGQTSSIGWCQFWNAGFVIGQVPQADPNATTAPAGTFIVWAEDPDQRPKFFRRMLTDDTQALGFESCGEAPYDATRSHKAFTWRFNTYGGNWIEPAGRYKRWLTDAFDMVPRAKRPGSAWVDDVALLWPAQPGNDAVLKSMAEVIDPKHVLMMDFGMLAGFNRRIPEYVPSDPAYGKKVAAARAMGYHAGCYTSLALLDKETHPTAMREYGLELFYPGLLADKPQVDAVKDWLVYVHPGSSTWQRFYADRMRRLHEELKLDFFYQDVTGCATGSAGLVEGRNFNQSILAGETLIRQTVPAAALGGEYWTEVNAAREDFGLATFSAWGGIGGPHWEFMSRPNQPHAVLSFLFSEYCLHWPHQVVLRDTDRFHRDQNVNEVTGAIPVWDTGPDDRSGEARLVLSRAKMLIDGFRPHFPADPQAWADGTASFMRAPDGRVVRYARRGEGTFCLERAAGAGAPERLRYARVTGVDHVSHPEPVTIDGWVAYGPQGPIGLDPKQWYCAFPAGADAPVAPLRLTSLPAGAVVTGTRVTDEYALVELGGGPATAGEVGFESANRPLFVTTPAGRQQPPPAAGAKIAVNGPASLLLGFKPPEPVKIDAPLPLERWRVQVVADGLVAGPGTFSEPQPRDIELSGQTRRAVRVGPPLGGVGSELSVDGFVELPDDPKIALRLSHGLFGGPGDGMNLVVRANGKEIWRQFRESTDAGWRDATVPLGAYAGQPVVLSFAVDCGPSGFNTSCDDAAWGDVRLVAAAE